MEEERGRMKGTSLTGLEVHSALGWAALGSAGLVWLSACLAGGRGRGRGGGRAKRRERVSDGEGGRVLVGGEHE